MSRRRKVHQREIYIVHNLLLDGYGNNPLPDPLITRAEELGRQGVAVQEAFTIDGTGTLWHRIEYTDDTVPPGKAKPEAWLAFTQAL